jgi:hypothetical protein
MAPYRVDVSPVDFSLARRLIYSGKVGSKAVDENSNDALDPTEC